MRNGEDTEQLQRCDSMKKNALAKDFFMEIKKTRNRFLSIMLIAALGVAFFAGVRAAAPDMNMSADLLYDKSKT